MDIRDDFNIPQDFQQFLSQQNQQDPNQPNPQAGYQDPTITPAPNNPTDADGTWDISGGNLKHDKGNSESPREMQGASSGGGQGTNPDFPNFNTTPAQPQTLSPPSPEAFMGTPTQPAAPAVTTPPVPSSPSPVGTTGNNETVQPLAKPATSELLTPSQVFGQSDVPAGTAPAPADTPSSYAPLPDPTADVQQFSPLGSGKMFGSAGGLLGGGLGIAGGQGSGAEENNILPILLQLLAQNKG